MLFSHFPPLMTIYVLAKGYQLFNDFLMVFEFVQYDIIFLPVEDESVYRRTIWLRPAEDFWGIWLQLRSTFLDWHWICMRYDFNVIKLSKLWSGMVTLQICKKLNSLVKTYKFKKRFIPISNKSTEFPNIGSQISYSKWAG